VVADFQKSLFYLAKGLVSACKNVIEIPQFGTKHSLNISVSAGIVVWDIVAKMIK